VLAEQAGLKFSKDWGECYTGNVQIERFAELVRQDEREVNENFKKMLFDMQNAAIDLTKLNHELVEALEKLARLGNRDQYGNSEGNTIAQAPLAKARGNT